MSLVKHAEVENDTTKHTALASTEEQSTSNQAAVAFHSAHAGAHYPPAHSQNGQIPTSADDLEQPVGWDVQEHVQDVKDC